MMSEPGMDEKNWLRNCITNQFPNTIILEARLKGCKGPLVTALWMRRCFKNPIASIPLEEEVLQEPYSLCVVVYTWQ